VITTRQTLGDIEYCMQGKFALLSQVGGKAVAATPDASTRAATASTEASTPAAPDQKQPAAGEGVAKQVKRGPPQAPATVGVPTASKGGAGQPEKSGSPQAAAGSAPKATPESRTNGALPSTAQGKAAPEAGSVGSKPKKRVRAKKPKTNPRAPPGSAA
jgi:hypothetical protein